MATNKQQQELWRMVTGRLKSAIGTENWLEAIALQDSLINERLESTLQYVYGNAKFLTLDKNIKLVKKLELLDDEIEILDLLDDWRMRRNIAMHQMVKYSESEYSLSWKERMLETRQAALVGNQLVKTTKNMCSRIKRRY